MSIETNTVLPDTIANELRLSILNQTDAPGSSLTEAAVALRFGVARPTARLAINKLVADGILRREVHRAAQVPKLDRNDIIDLFDNRALIESQAMAILATRGEIPATALKAHRALKASEDFARHDIDFHRGLVAGQPSPRLARMHSLLMGEIELCIGQVQAAHLLTSTEIFAQHQGILDAITAGHAASAATLTRDHIAGARDRLLDFVDRKNHG